MAEPGEIAVLADAGPGAGLGHLGRAGAVATALEELGRPVRRLAHGAVTTIELGGRAWEPVGDPAAVTGAAAALVDSYAIAPDALRALASRLPLALFVDAGAAPDEAALVVRIPAPEARDARELTGLRYACLGSDYWDAQPRAQGETVERVLVTTGGGDHADALVAAAAGARAALPGATVVMLRPPGGPAPPRGVELLDGPVALAGELRAADIAVTGAGVTMLEAAALGTPVVAMILAENQRPQAQALAAAGGVVLAAPDEVGAHAARLAGLGTRVALGARAQAAVDGSGARRVAERVSQLVTAGARA